MALNAQQLAVVESDGNILCCACPGSGKTRTLTEKVVRELRENDSSRILMTTFTREAAQAMTARVKRMLLDVTGEDKARVSRWMSRINVGTFHALALKQLKGVGPVGRFLNAAETQHIIEGLLERLNLPMTAVDAEMAISLHKVDGFPSDAPAEVLALVELYQAALAERRALDFTDLMLRANALMAQGKMAALPADLALFDEFQDVDRLQFEWMMHTLAAGNGRAVAVGDDDQAIYGFRRSLGYQGMMDFVRHTGADIIKLGVNYRSTAGIVSSASRLIGLNLNRVQKQFSAARGPGPVPEVVMLGKEDDQALAIVHRLDVICGKNPLPDTLPGEKVSRFGVLPNQVAVLARSNQQLQAIEEGLREAGVPCHRAGRNFWDMPILSIFTTLLAAICKADALGVEVALRWARVETAELERVKKAAGGSAWGLLDAGAVPVTQPGHGWSRNLQAFAEVCRTWPIQARDAHAGTNRLIQGVATWMAAVVNHTAHGVFQEAPPEKEQTLAMQRKVAMLALGRDQLRAWPGRLWERLPENRARVRRQAAEDDQAGVPRVCLGTFHGSKGLEYDHVYLVDIYEGSVPKLAQDAGEDELAEERRVFYVAMTRAKDSLTILARRDKAPSEFLTEAGLK